MLKDYRKTTGPTGRVKYELDERTYREYAAQAADCGVDSEILKIPNAGTGQTKKRKDDNRRIRAYFNMLWRTALPSGDRGGFLLLLLDPDGCQIMTRGDERLRAEAARTGICDGAVWRIDSTGPNALSISTLEGRSVCSVGKQQYLSILSPYVLCCTPLQIERSSFRKKLGSIALIAGAGAEPTMCQTILSIVTGDLLIHYESSLMIGRGYQTQTSGLAWLDINVKSGEIMLTHHNDAFLEILEISSDPGRDLYFTPLTDYIDPLPYNSAFWDILHGFKNVKEKEIQLLVGGKRKYCIISTREDNDLIMDTKSILLQIDTRSRMTRAISEKTSNSAVMTFDTVIGSCPAMQSAIRKAKILSGTESNVLLFGESGVGKDVFAQAIHNASARRDKPFVAVNCGALPRDLIGSELFGYEGGAFTGAKKQGNIGKFELANGGTLFLDEVGELPLDLQATLLRAVEQKSFMRIGSNQLIDVDVKIISATNADIPQMIREKRFRMDLFYRLGTMYLQIPPLRARGRDAVQLAEYFIASICSRIRRGAPKILSPDAQDLLCRLPWPGNVRELQNLMECLVQLYPEEIITARQIRESLSPLGGGAQQLFSTAELIRMPETSWEAPPEDLTVVPHETQISWGTPPGGWNPEVGERAIPADELSSQEKPAEGAFGMELPAEEAGQEPAQPEPAAETETFHSRDTRGLLTREEIERALQACGGNRSKAAKYLGIARKTLYRNLERLGMQTEK